jgi:hypothetical protein
MVRRGSIWCGVAQMVARRLAGRQARVRFSARHHREFCPTELTGDEEMERGLGECVDECDWMIVCMLQNMKNKQKEWHSATKPLYVKEDFCLDFFQEFGLSKCSGSLAIYV